MMHSISRAERWPFEGIMLAEAGERPNQNKIMNKDAKPLTQEQRKEFVQLLKDSKTRLLGNLMDTNWKRREKARDAAREELLKRIGAAEEATKLREAKKAIKSSETALEKLGVFFNSSNRITFSDDHESEYSAEIEDAAEAILQAQTETIRKQYEMAILNVLSTESVDDAKAIVEPLV
jgi:hypothetical protein